MTDATGDIAMVKVRRPGLRRRLVVAVSLVLVVVAATTALMILRSVDAQMQDIESTYEVRSLARDLVRTILDAETGQRGYLLTQDDDYLEPYRAAVANLDRVYRNLSDLIGDDEAQRRRIESLVEPLNSKRSEMATTIAMAREGRLGEAMTILRSDTGQTLMATIRSTMDALIAEEDARLLQRNSHIQGWRTSLTAMILVALAGATLLTYLLFARTRREVSSLSRTRSELQSQNLELERRVGERTAELEEARAHAERERARVEALLQESNHRIGNSLATVSSLLGLQLTRSPSAEVREALEAAQSRVQAIASGHRRLRLGADLETANAAEFLTAVTEDLQATQVGARKVTLDADIDPLTINARDATTLGIIVGELVINALKHAFTDEQGGRIRVGLRPHAGGGVVLEVEDDGNGMPAGAEHNDQGLGGTIIRQLSRQYGGEVRYEARAGGGTTVSVVLPELHIATSAEAPGEPGAQPTG